MKTVLLAGTFWVLAGTFWVLLAGLWALALARAAARADRAWQSLFAEYASRSAGGSAGILRGLSAKSESQRYQSKDAGPGAFPRLKAEG
jgi:hypothetical protein